MRAREGIMRRMELGRSMMKRREMKSLMKFWLSRKNGPKFD